MKPADGKLPRFKHLEVGYVAHDSRDFAAERWPSPGTRE
jgi:hypothetical protein